jgi:hypothetical protein
MVRYDKEQLRLSKLIPYQIDTESGLQEAQQEKKWDDLPSLTWTKR